MTDRDEQLTRAVQAALDAAIEAADNPRRIIGTRRAEDGIDRPDLCIHRRDASERCPYCQIDAIRAIDPAEVLAKVPPAETRILALPYPMHGYGVCVGPRFNGWLMWKHPDGQWVSKSKLPQETPQ